MQTPAAAAHPPPPSARAIEAADSLAFEAIMEFAALSESYSRSAAEAAWRGDRATLRVHLSQLRTTVVAALRTFKHDLSAEAPENTRPGVGTEPRAEAEARP